MLRTLCLSLLLALPVSDQEEAASWLSKLESTAAAERGAAQRWLSANLVAEDFEALHEAAVMGGAEGDRRLVDVLASSERHFELAVLLGGDTQGKVARIGRGALLELASAWSVAAEDPGVRRLKANEQFGERASRLFTVEPRKHELGSLLELLNLAGDTGVSLVLDPDLLQSRTVPTIDRRTATWLTGTPAELLAALGRSYSFGFDAFGLDETGDMAWVRVCRRLRAGKTPARELLVDWSLRVAKQVDSEAGGSNTAGARDAQVCARALAASGWPAAITWLEGRWLERGDEAALAGLRLLASRGFTSPRIRSEAMQAAWLNGGRARGALEETARALGALGRLSATGDDLEAGLLDGWGKLEPWEQWLRLVALEQRGSNRKTSREPIISTLLNPRSSPALAYQALRTAVVLDLEFGESLPSERVGSLFKLGCGIDEGRELPGLLLRLGVRPQAGLETKTWSEAERLALCEWYFLVGHSESRATWESLMRGLASQSDLVGSPAGCRLVSRLREWKHSGYGERLGDWLSALEGQAPELACLRVHLGLLQGPAAEALVGELLRKARESEETAAELQGLAAFAASARGPEILDLLAERAALSRGLPLVRALDEAVRILREERLDARLKAFVAKVRLAGWQEAWPSALRPRVTALRVFERRFEP